MLYALCPTCHHKWRAPPGKDAAAKLLACPHCGAAGVLAHAELPDLTIGHLDCDAFYASIEKRDRPELADQPVIIGGGHRGVVSTCCYVARKYGVRSAMPAFKARALCPDGVFLPPDMAKYQREGLKIRDMMRALTPIIEPLSIDEAFLDLTDCTERLGKSPAECLATLQARIRAEIGITVSIGLSYNKFLAKIASDLNKPFGVFNDWSHRSTGFPCAKAGADDVGRGGGNGTQTASGCHHHHRPVAGNGYSYPSGPLWHHRQTVLLFLSRGG
ncbi:MAG: hypothetical protein ABID63_07075 [Pseudomonadota bacterium]